MPSVLHFAKCEGGRRINSDLNSYQSYGLNDIDDCNYVQYVVGKEYKKVEDLIGNITTLLGHQIWEPRI